MKVKRTEYMAIFIDGNQWGFVPIDCYDAHSISDVWKKLKNRPLPRVVPPSAMIVVVVVEMGGCRLRIVDTPVGLESLKGQILEVKT